jgi:hypothetical protein
MSCASSSVEANVALKSVYRTGKKTLAVPIRD